MASDEIINAAPTKTPVSGKDPQTPMVSVVTVEKLKRKRRLQKISLAVGAIIGVAVTIAIVSNRYFATESLENNEPVLPSVLMQELLTKFKSDPKNSTFQVVDFAVDDSIVKTLAELESIETLILDKGVVTDASIGAITGLPNIRQVRLRLSPITDEGLRKLAECPTLMFLNLPHARCTSAGVAELTKLPKLRQLRLGSPELSNDVTREIAKIKTLQSIHLIGVPVTDEGLKALAEMPRLESLYLDDSSVTESGWQWLFDRHAHLHVHINQQHHDRDPQKHEHHD